MATKTLVYEFQTFMNRTHDNLPALPSVQITETRRAFMAGAWTVLTMLDAEEISYEKHLLHEELKRECRDFVDRMQKGEV